MTNEVGESASVRSHTPECLKAADQPAAHAIANEFPLNHSGKR